MKNYLYLPEHFHNGHDICIDLVKQIEDVIISKTYLPLREVQIELSELKLGKNEHILDFLLRTQRTDDHNKVIKSNILISLLIDSSYFLFEALEASLRKRLTVCMALLRKPLVYNLIVLLRLIFEKGFVDRFNNDPSFDPARISREDRVELIKMSLKLMLLVPFTTEEIDDWIFNKDNPESVINLSDMALHLTTSRNATILTGAQNFNFVFSGQEEIMSQWDFLYR
jgi:hypothetical protein